MGSIIIVENNGHISAALGVLILSEPYTGDTVAHEIFWYSIKKIDGIKLFKFFTNWIKGKNCVRVYMTSVSKLKHLGVDKFYTKNGFKELEIVYYKEVA